jgi:hypothetical protein
MRIKNIILILTLLLPTNVFAKNTDRWLEVKKLDTIYKIRITEEQQKKLEEKYKDKQTFKVVDNGLILEGKQYPETKETLDKIIKTIEEEKKAQGIVDPKPNLPITEETWQEKLREPRTLKIIIGISVVMLVVVAIIPNKKRKEQDEK